MANVTESFKAPYLDLIDPEYNGKNLTNRVLVEQIGIQIKKKMIYYCPAYIRINVKNFQSIDHSNLHAEVNLTIVLTLNMQRIPKLIDQEVRKKMVLRFNRNEALKLSDDSVSIIFKQKKQTEPGIYTYIVRKLLSTGMVTEVFLSPFQKIYLILSITVQSIILSSETIQAIIETELTRRQELEDELAEIKKTSDMQLIREKQLQIETVKKDIKDVLKILSAEIKFNFMDFDDNFCKISYTQEGTHGNYDLAEKLLRVEYTNENTARMIRNKNEGNAKKQNQNFAEIKEFQNAHFQICLYKFPTTALFTIFFPLWLLGIINLGIFFQGTGLGDRIGSISALIIAFVALIPVIRQQMPTNPNLTLVEILVYLQTFTTLLCFIESVIIRESTTFVFVWYHSALFLVSACIQIVQIIIIMIMMLLYTFKWKKQYNQNSEDQNLRPFNYKQWFSVECDNHFRRKIEYQQIKILQKKQEQSPVKRRATLKQQMSMNEREEANSANKLLFKQLEKEIEIL